MVGDCGARGGSDSDLGSEDHCDIKERTRDGEFRKSVYKTRSKSAYILETRANAKIAVVVIPPSAGIESGCGGIERLNF